MPEMRTCKRCGLTFELAFFPIKAGAGLNVQPRRSGTCSRCHQIAKDARKQGPGRFVEKARSARYRHATKFAGTGVIASREDLEQEYGWNLERMAHEGEHTYTNGCPYCAVPFAEMSGGDLSNLTIDIINPADPPYWGLNARWVCKTCNRKKSRTDPAAWAADQQRWRRAEQIIQAPSGRWADRLFDLDAPPPPLRVVELRPVVWGEQMRIC